MRLPLFQFRDRQGEVLNLSTVEDRDVIERAELYHIIDVDTGVWCKSCQSTGCPHATQIEQILATAGLGATTGAYHELPGIARITRYDAASELVVACWFDNDARVCCYEQRDGTVVQSVYPPDNDGAPADESEKPDAESVPSCLFETLATYCQYRQRGDLDGLRRCHPELACVVGADASSQMMDRGL